MIKVAQEHSAPDTVPLPATATREISEQLRKDGLYSARVISRTPLNPANRPESGFEEEAIRALESGHVEAVRVEPVNGVMTFKRLTPDRITSEACIACHAGTKMGDMVGAVSVQIPIGAALDRVNHQVVVLYAAATTATGVMTAVLFFLLRWQVLVPLLRLRGAMEQIAQGNNAARAPVAAQDELGLVTQAFNQMAEQIQTGIAKQAEASQMAAAAARETASAMAAIGKTQAVIEFNLDGTVITANQNFLSILGYSLDEIKGRHHRMFCEPTYTNSGEYQAFWEKLNRGEYDAAVYRWLGKGGKEVWAQASYNPILDANGKPYKVMKFATDITGQKKAQSEVEKLIKAATAGQLSERIKTEQFEGAAKELTVSFNTLLDAVVTPLHEAQGILNALAASDLTKAMTGSYQGEFDQMKSSLNQALQNLTTTVTTVRDAVENVTTGSEQISKGSEDLAQRTSEQASALEETSASMER